MQNISTGELSERRFFEGLRRWDVVRKDDAAAKE